MKKTEYEGAQCEYSIQGCTLTSIEKEKRKVRLIFMEGIHKGEKMTDGFIEIDDVYHDSVMISKKSLPLKSVHHLDLRVEGLSIGDGYAYVNGKIADERCLLCIHYGGHLIYHTTF